MPLAALPLLLIPYDSLTYLFGIDAATVSQTFPTTAVFSLAYIVLRQGHLRTTPVGRNVLSLLFAAIACIAAVTLINLLCEAVGLRDGDVQLRLFAAMRQAIALALGFTTFLMFLDAIARLGVHSACRWIVVGCIPSLLVGAVQYAQGQTRIQGLSPEPSLLGDMLVLAFLPACVYSGLTIHKRLAAFFSGSFALMVAFSGTAMMKALFELLSFFAVRGNLVRGAGIAAVAMSIMWGILLLNPDNYIFHLWNLFQSFLDSGTLVGGSFIDRFFGFVGPVSLLDQPEGWFGLGLGGDSVYFRDMFSAATAEGILAVKVGLPQISSHQGKMMLYGGLLGYALYLAAWWVAWRAAPARHPARFMIPTVFAASVFSLGPFFLPYVWLWLAFGATAEAPPAARRADVLPSPSPSGLDAPGHPG